MVARWLVDIGVAVGLVVFLDLKVSAVWIWAALQLARFLRWLVERESNEYFYNAEDRRPVIMAVFEEMLKLGYPCPSTYKLTKFPHMEPLTPYLERVTSNSHLLAETRLNAMVHLTEFNRMLRENQEDPFGTRGVNRFNARRYEEILYGAMRLLANHLEPNGAPR
jgi:hypothetical protein